MSSSDSGDLPELNDTSTNVLKKMTNFENALQLNKEMQKKLVIVRSKILILREKIACRYAENEERLIENMSTKKDRKNDGLFGKMVKGLTFFIRGNTFFKDENKRNCPNNEDYRKRLKNGEMFPMDFDLVARHIWSISDKMSVVRAIKEQIITERSLSVRVSNRNTQTAQLLEKVGNDLKIDWEEISSHSLRYRHSPTSCKAMWEVYLQPSLKHENFSEIENERLGQAAQKYNFQNWSAIAKEVEQRSDYQCFLQYHTTLVFRNKWLRWDKKDDSRLLEVIESAKCNGVINWSQVAFHFPQKPKQALQQRYQYAINPVISHAPFSHEEDLLLIAAVKEYGTNFAKMPRSLFPNRSVIQLRGRYNNTLQHRHKCQPWTLSDDKFLMDFVNTNGASAWKKLEEAFDNRHSRIACRQRYVVIERYLKKHPNASLEQIARKQTRNLRTQVTTTNWQEKVEELRNNSSKSSLKETHKRRKNLTKLEISKEQTTDDELAADCVSNDVKNVIQHRTTAKRALKRKRSIQNAEVSQLQEGTQNIVKEVVSHISATNTSKSKEFNDNELLVLDENLSPKHKVEAQRNEYKCKARHRQTKKPIYLERLRANGLRFHDFLKFSYNFRFGRSPVINYTNYMDEILKAKDCLGFQMPKAFDQRDYTVCLSQEHNINGLCSPVGRIQGIRMLLCSSVMPGSTLEPMNNFHVPPNFSTLCSLRALCALSAHYGKEDAKKLEAKNENEDQKLLKPNAEHLIALNRFRQRFRNLFYKTAVLSRLPPSSLESQIQRSCSNNQEDGSLTETPICTGRNIQADRLNSQEENSSTNTSAYVGTQIIKNEFVDENESFTPIIKTEIDFEAYKETN